MVRRCVYTWFGYLSLILICHFCKLNLAILTYIYCVFHSGRIITLVAITTYIPLAYNQESGN